MLVASIVTSYWVYDRSGILTGRWIGEMIPGGPTRWCNLHAGLDHRHAAVHWEAGGQQAIPLDEHRERGRKRFAIEGTG